MRVVLYGAGLGFLFFLGYCGLLLAAMHLHERRRRNLEGRAVKAPQREATAREYPSTPVEELSREELDALYTMAEETEEQDYLLFCQEAQEPGWVDAGIEWAGLHAAWKQPPVEEIHRKRDEWLGEAA